MLMMRQRGRSPVGSGTTLMWLIRHMARAEITWVLYRFAGQDVVVPGDEPEPEDTLATVSALYRATWPASGGGAVAVRPHGQCPGDAGQRRGARGCGNQPPASPR
jgi:hypothetical protein